MIKDILLHVSRSYTPYIPVTDYMAAGETRYGTMDDAMAAGLYQKVNYTGSITNINTIAAGELAYFIAPGNTLWGWGGVGQQLGINNDSVYRSSPVQIGTETNWESVSTGQENAFTLAIKTNGTLWSWGSYNLGGELATGDTAGRSLPTQIGTRTNWSKVKAGFGSVLALTSTGELWGWGVNTSGQLASTDKNNRSSPIQIGKELWNDVDLQVLDFDTGRAHAIAVVQNGFDTTNLRDLWGWGVNTSGQLGLNDVVSRSSPVQITIGLFANDPSFKKVACGESHTIALMEETPGVPNALHRTLWAWGANGSGQHGRNDTVNRSSPVQIGTRTDWDRPYADTDVTFAIAHNDTYGNLDVPGTLWGWGRIVAPSELSYGIQTQGQSDQLFRSTPVQITIPNKQWRQISLNRSRSVANVEPGEVYSAGWGQNNTDDSSSSIKRGYPRIKTTPIELVFGNDYSGSKQWSKISSLNHTVAIDSNGKLYTWGLNNVGQLGIGNTTSLASPNQVGSDNWLDAKVTENATFAIKSDGTLWSWGGNTVGVLGINAVGDRSSPVQIGTETNWSKFPSKLGGYVAAAIKTDNSLWMWGFGSSGQLGNGGTNNRSIPVVVGASTQWDKVSVSESHTMAVRTNGTLWGWGINANGQLGDTTTTQRNSPVQVGTRTDWIDVQAARFGTYALRSDKSFWAFGSPESIGHGRWVDPNYFTYVYEENVANPEYTSAAIGVAVGFLLKSDGTLWSWGRSTLGNLGTVAIGPRSNLAQIPSNVTWESVAAGKFNSVLQNVTTDTAVSTFAIKTNGTLWGWGSNSNNQLGIASTLQHRSSPVQIGTLSTWSGGKLAAGNASGYIIRSDGTLWSWGNNAAGQLGIGGTANRSIPTQVGNRSNWSLVSAFHQHVGAITTGGELFMWGLNDYNQLGTNDGSSRQSPVQIGTETNWSKVQPGYRFTMAVKTDGTLWGWGDQSLSQIGNGVTSTRISSPVQIGIETNWSKIGVNTAGGFGIKTNGTLWAWGAAPGASGAQYWGDGTTTHRSSPSQVGSETNYVDIFSGQGSLLFSKTNNRIMQNSSGGGGGVGYIRFMPDNTSISRSSPIIVGQYTSIDSVYAGHSGLYNHTNIVTKRTDNTLYYFGINAYGQYGDGTQAARSSPIQLSYDSSAVDVFVGGTNIIVKKTY